MNYLLYILIGVAGFILGRYVKRDSKSFAPQSDDEMDEMREEAHEALSERTEMRKEKILLAIRGSQTEGKEGACVPKPFTSEDVENLFEVSDRTARKYLNELEGEGKIKQIGSTGLGVHYVLNT